MKIIIFFVILCLHITLCTLKICTGSKFWEIAELGRKQTWAWSSIKTESSVRINPGPYFYFIYVFPLMGSLYKELFLFFKSNIILQIKFLKKEWTHMYEGFVIIIIIYYSHFQIIYRQILKYMYTIIIIINEVKSRSDALQVCRMTEFGLPGPDKSGHVQTSNAYIYSSGYNHFSPSLTHWFNIALLSWKQIPIYKSSRTLPISQNK